MALVCGLFSVSLRRVFRKKRERTQAYTPLGFKTSSRTARGGNEMLGNALPAARLTIIPPLRKLFFFFFFPSLSHEVHLSFSSDAGLRSSPSWRLSVADYRWHKKKKKSLLSPDFRQTKRMERHKKRGQVSWISCFSGAKGWTNATSNDRGTVPLVFAEKLNAHYSTLWCNASVTVLGRAGEGELRRLTMQK